VLFKVPTELTGLVAEVVDENAELLVAELIVAVEPDAPELVAKGDELVGFKVFTVDVELFKAELLSNFDTAGFENASFDTVSFDDKSELLLTDEP
jgi:hypothetical protein